jgi:hypothetical protein
MRNLTAAAAALAALATLAACDASFSLGNDGNGNSAEAPPATKHFVNSRENARSEALREAYIDFTFDYPGNWSETPQPTDGTAQNYVRVAAPAVHGYTPYAFHVGYASGSGNAEEDRATMEPFTQQIAEQFGRSMENYRIVSVGPDRVGQYDSFAWRFTATGPGQNGEPPAEIYGRGDIVLPPGSTRGVALISLATDRAQAVRRAEEVGESGPLKEIMDSLRLTPVPPAG